MDRVVEVIGFAFGMSQFTSAIVGMSHGISALCNVHTLEANLKEAGILAANAESD